MFGLRYLVFRRNDLAHLCFAIGLIWWPANLGMTAGQTVKPFPKPQVTIHLAKLGWKNSSPESDKSFFRTFSLEKLQALDGGTKILFLNDSTLVAFHGIQESQEAKDWRTVPRELEAFFFRAEDGTLLFKKRWVTRPRKDSRDTWETEARLIRVTDDRFLVHASGVLMLYSSKDYSLLKEKKLDPAGLSDIWMVQAVPEGRHILLRHGHPSRAYATYEWLTSDTLESVYRTQTDSLRIPVGLDHFIVGDSTSGLQRLGPDAPAASVCQNLSCPSARELAALSSQSIAFLARTGVGVIDIRQGLLWQDEIDPRTIPQVDTLRSAVTGKRFAFSMLTLKKAFLHGERVGSTFAVFVYDADARRPLYRLRSEPAFDCALSPDGKQIALSSAEEVKIYSIN